jgi:hypothetical protein
MSFLYRSAITITRKQPFLDWANDIDDDGPALSQELADDRRTVYLVPESTQRPVLSELIDEFWESIFEEELASWMEDEDSWPSPLTREMFDEWFDAVATDSVFDLTPEEPLTEMDVEAAELEDVAQFCAWCEAELDQSAVRFVSFKLADRGRFAAREGLVFPVVIDDERVAVGIMSGDDSEAAREGRDVVFAACTSRCEKILRKVVSKALRKVPGAV